MVLRGLTTAAPTGPLTPLPRNDGRLSGGEVAERSMQLLQTCQQHTHLATHATHTALPLLRHLARLRGRVDSLEATNAKTNHARESSHLLE